MKPITPDVPGQSAYVRGPDHGDEMPPPPLNRHQRRALAARAKAARKDQAKAVARALHARDRAMLATPPDEPVELSAPPPSSEAPAPAPLAPLEALAAAIRARQGR